MCGGMTGERGEIRVVAQSRVDGRIAFGYPASAFPFDGPRHDARAASRRPRPHLGVYEFDDIVGEADGDLC